MLRDSRKLLITIGLSAALIAGVALGAFAGKSGSGTRSQDYYDSLELFGRVYERISRNYVDELDPEELIDAAIQGMLDELDTHSQMLVQQAYDDLMISTQGEFGGLGIQITLRDDWITVVSPMEGTPAYFMGIQGGDRIVEIEGENTEGWRTNDAVKKLRGPKGTDVTIGIERVGEEKILHFTITRDIIKIESVPFAFMIDDESKVGYVRVTNFARTTAEELRDALDQLEDQGMERLLVDLRFNPGGLLNAAKDVSEIFLEQGELIVYTKGRYAQNNLNYYATRSSGIDWGDKPMLVLVNGSSASASEILAGAIQDHDVGLVSGTQTFGKGSVQTVFDLNPEKALKLTTARYYTPSGRSIHRERDRKGHEMGEETELVEEGTEDDVEQLEGEVFYTDMGREVFGGGGINPDVVIEPSLLSDFAVSIERDGIFFTFANEYAAFHADIPVDFEVNDDVLDEFYTMATGRENLMNNLEEFELEWNRELFDENVDYVSDGIRRELMRRVHGSEAAYRISILDDNQLWEAVGILKRSETSRDLFGVAEEINAEKLAEAAKEDDEEAVKVP